MCLEQRDLLRVLPRTRRECNPCEWIYFTTKRLELQNEVASIRVSRFAVDRFIV